MGPITKVIQKEFYAIVRGEKDDRHGLAHSGAGR